MSALHLVAFSFQPTVFLLDEPTVVTERRVLTAKARFDPTVIAEGRSKVAAGAPRAKMFLLYRAECELSSAGPCVFVTAALFFFFFFKYNQHFLAGLCSLGRTFSWDSVILFLLCLHAGLTSGNLDISGFALANGILCTRNNVLHESAFMQTFCLREERLCIGGTVYRSILQTGDKAFESRPCRTWIVRLGLFWDIIESVLSI